MIFSTSNDCYHACKNNIKLVCSEVNVNKDLLIAKEEKQTVFNAIYKRTIKQLLNRLLAERNNDRIYTLLGFCYKKTNKLNKAISYFEKAIMVNQEAFSAFYQMGLCGLKLNKTCIAVNSFIKAIQSNPTNPYAVLNLGIAHEYCEEPDMAFMIYERLIETTPEFLPAYEKKAELFIKMSHYSDAIPLLNNMVKRNPNHTGAYEKLGKCYKKLGKTSYASRCFRKVLTTNASAEICSNAIRELKQINNRQEKKFQLC